MVPLISDAEIAQILTYVLLAGMTDVPPYSTGIFETIVGVHWAAGLAVEFFPGTA
jgi:hypothetical protein